ncbi:MAG: RNA polymerase sigma factor [Pseudomonadota bacterium]
MCAPGNEVEAGIEALLPRFWRFAISLTRDPQLAEDLVQDTCLRMLEKWQHFRPGTHLDRWGFTVMANLWRSNLRRKTPQMLDDEAMERVEDNAPLPDRHFFVGQVLDAIDALPEAQRSLVVLVYGEGFSYREAADIMDVPIGTVMSRLHTARAKLAHLSE